MNPQDRPRNKPAKPVLPNGNPNGLNGRVEKQATKPVDSLPKAAKDGSIKTVSKQQSSVADSQNTSISTNSRSIDTQVQAGTVRDVIIQKQETKDHNARYAIVFLISIVTLALGGAKIYPTLALYFFPKTNQEIILIIHEGDEAIRSGDYAQALKKYQEAADFLPGDSALGAKIDFLEKALAYADLGDEERAEEAFKMVLSIQPDLGIEMGVVDSTTAFETPEGQIPPIRMVINRLSASLVEIRISGGTPFTDPNAPYKLNGIRPENEIKWRKKGDTYIALLSNMTNEDYLSIRISDSKGDNSQKKIPPAEAAGLFDMHKQIADNWFIKKEFARAKQAYTKALDYQPKDTFCRRRITECDKEIAWLEAKNIETIEILGGPLLLGNGNGDADEGPEHLVVIDGFKISKYEITVAEYRSFCQATGKSMPPEPSWGWNDEHPIVNVSWEDASAYALWVGGRLPTEAEWEYAARGGSKSQGFTYAGSNNLNECGWFRSNSPDQTTHSVGSKPVENELGLADMSGNVSEWCSDWYGGAYYATIPNRAQNPKGPVTGANKVFRGGHWFGLESFASVSYRNNNEPEFRANYLGFRVVKPIKTTS